MRELTISLHGAVIPKKNSKRILKLRNGKRIIASSESHIKWHKNAMTQLMTQGVRKHCLIADVEVTIKFYFSTMRRKDMTNLAESIMDLLVDYGVISDDCWTVCPVINLSAMPIMKQKGVDPVSYTDLTFISIRGE
jgi:Holliday junction resolvase RusA-like endonuclease